MRKQNTIILHSKAFWPNLLESGAILAAVRSRFSLLMKMDPKKAQAILSEISAIKNCVAESLSETGFEKTGGTLFAMGGTAKAIEKLYNAAIEKNDILSLKNVNIMLKLLTEAPDEAKELIAEFAPKRIRTLVPGLAVLAGVMEKAGCEGMKIYSVGVREGFMESILNDDSKPEPGILDLILGSI